MSKKISKNKNNFINLLVALAFAVAVIGGITVVSDNDEATVPENDLSGLQVSDNEAVFSTDQKTVTYQGETGKTALEVLQGLTDVTGTEDPSLGFYVTGINGLEANADNNEFWAFYINGDSAQVGAGSYDSMDGDELQWVLETF